MRKLFPLFIFVFCSTSLFAQYDADRYPVIPRPYTLLPFNGEFSLSNSTVIVTDNKFYRNEIDAFRDEVKNIYGVDLKYSNKKVSSGFIYISEDSTDIPDEGYDLFINRNEINIYGGHAGIFYALQSLFQLILNPNTDLGPVGYHIPSCSIVDQPRFPWRGMHLDVSRHFYDKEKIKEYLRWMAMYKLNVFHWHLTDDQGWRIEIKKYPELTSVGAWRSGTLIGHEGANDPPQYDTLHYGGFYTQDDIREIVKYAQSLHITIVPEIEMPGHSLAALAAYPELSCTGGPFEVSKTWGVFDDVMCPNEKTFEFIDEVVKEVSELFPGQYIHIGGDECPKARWKADPYCQKLIADNKLKDENELQSWFTKKVVAILQKYHKNAIGWDEILEGGLADGAAVMSWRGEDGGIAAAKAKHNVVMSPGGWCYFDHYQSQNNNEPLAIGGYLPLDKVYSYDPVPASLNADEKKYIMGVQANVWTEYIGTWPYVQYMVFPRICALAEVAWTIPQEKNYSHFEERVIQHFHLLDKLNINYAKSIFDLQAKITSNSFSGISLGLNTNKKNAKIMYWFNEGDSARHYVYDFPITINKPLTVHAALFIDGKQLGNENTWVFNYNLATGKPISLRKPPNKSYNTGGAFSLIDGIEGQTNPWRGNEWLGFLKDTLDLIIDLGKTEDSISEIGFDYLVDHGSWIHAPVKYQIEISTDGKNYSPANLPLWGHLESEGGDKQNTHGWSNVITVVDPNDNNEMNYAKARFIHIIVYPQLKIPPGNPGEGMAAWLFVSEIEVH
ncbi:MAG: beta-N-acetylhexosaminidase [Bacteroidetes bacterium]|nr:beta-N-acetylhexosaminidase [Bacteroidota bacterium]